MKTLSRRSLLKQTGAAAAGVLLSTSGCAPGQPPASTKPTEVLPAQAAETAAEEQPAAVEQPAAAEGQPAAATELPAATEPTRPTATPEPPSKTYSRPDALRFYPDQPSRVVQARNPAVWQGDVLDPAALRAMVDASITRLTGIDDVLAAWQALFRPDERIAIKVNAFRNSTIWTHPALVKVVTDSLQEAGIPGENITIFDYYTTELTTAGYPVNPDGPGVRCYGTDQRYGTKVNLHGVTFPLSDILNECDALINMPVLKSHMIAGLTFALKNHYGSVSNPDSLHNIERFLPALNALPQIKDTTRLVIGDVLEANTRFSYSFPYWKPDYQGDTILMSFDPLAHDSVGMEMLLKLAEEKQNPTKNLIGMAEPWFKTANEAGIGTADKDKIDLVTLDMA